MLDLGSSAAAKRLPRLEKRDPVRAEQNPARVAVVALEATGLMSISRNAAA